MGYNIIQEKTLGIETSNNVLFYEENNIVIKSNNTQLPITGDFEISKMISATIFVMSIFISVIIVFEWRTLIKVRKNYKNLN